MIWDQVFTIIASILIPMIACFGWMISRMDKKFLIADQKNDDRYDKLDLKIDSVKKDLEVKIDKLDLKIDKVKDEVSLVKERLAFMEAETVVYNMIPDPNARSEAAKKMWQRRKTKQLMKHPKGE